MYHTNNTLAEIRIPTASGLIMFRSSAYNTVTFITPISVNNAVCYGAFCVVLALITGKGRISRLYGKIQVDVTAPVH
jgi:hypothetical protein